MLLKDNYSGKFTKKPITIEAFQISPKRVNEFHKWCEQVGFSNWRMERDGTIAITTLEGIMTAKSGDWIIKGIKGEFYPCKPDIFEESYQQEVIEDLTKTNSSDML